MSDDVMGYTVKDILIRIDGKLDVMDAKLEQKAERTRVHELAAAIGVVDVNAQILDRTTVKKDGPEMDEIDERLSRVERWQTGAIVLSGWQRWFFGTVCVGMVAALATLVWLAAGH